MTIDDAHGATRRVAVGRTRELAATVFGRGHDDLFLTTYDDVGREVDLDGPVALDLVVDEEAQPLLVEACARLVLGGPRLRIAVRPGSASELAALLERAAVVVAGVDISAETVLLTLVPRPDAQPGGTDVLLAALDAGGAAGAPPTPAPRRAGVRRSGTAGNAGPERPAPMLLGVLTRADRWRRGTRRRALLAAALVVLLVASLLVGLVPDTAQPLLSISVPVLVVLLLGGTALSCYTTLLLARQVHRQTGRLERMALRNREVVQQRAHHLDRRLERMEKALAGLPFLEQYVEAVAENSAASNARLRDLMESLDLGQTVDRSRSSQ